MHLFEIIQPSPTLNIKNKEGSIGYVTINDNIDYMGLRVMMTPRTFHQLAEPLPPYARATSRIIKRLMLDGEPVASPFLDIEIPTAWADDDYSQPARVRSHEGRNRMYAILDIFGNVPVETHLIFSHHLRNHDIKPEWIEQLRTRLIPQRKDTPKVGNLFMLKTD